jgi:predicted MFS family arabinose efflux permease
VRLTIFLLALAAFASTASMRVTDALMPRLALDFGIGIARASAVITGFTVAYGLMQILFGPLGDRYGKLRVISLASAAAALATLACFLVGGFEALVVSRVLAGAFCGAIIPLSVAWIGDAVPYQQRQPVLARYLLGQVMGISSGMVAGGFASGHDDWRWPFAAIALWLGVSAALLFRASLRDPARAQAPGASFFRNLLEVVRVPWARVVLVTVFAEGCVVFGALAFIPTHLHFVRGFDLPSAALSVVAFSVGGLFFALFAGRAVRRLGEVGLATTGAIFLAVGLAAIAFATSRGFAGASCLVAGLGFYMLHNTLQTNASQMAPERRGASMAFFASCLFIGQSSGIALVAALAERLGTTPILVAAAVAVLPVGIAFAYLRSSHRTRETSA